MIKNPTKYRIILLHSMLFVICFFLEIQNAHAQIIATLAGNDTAGYSGDGGAANVAELNFPSSVAVDHAGNIYVADYYNNVIRKINSLGIISTIAGSDSAGYSGDGGPATAARLYLPFSIATDTSGNLYIADTYNMRVRKVSSTGVISTIAGNGTVGYSGDGGAATAATLSHPTGICVDNAGNVYIADEYNNRIRKVNTSGVISTIAGTDTAGYSGDGGNATAAKLYSPFGVTIDGAGNVYIAEWGNNIIRKVNSSGIISTFAGGGTAGLGDGGVATAAVLNHPIGVTIDGTGNVYIADYNNSRIRKVNDSGVISTIAGTGTDGNAGDGRLAKWAELYNPCGIAIDGNGKMYIADGNNNKVRKICPPPLPITGPSYVCWYGSITLSDSTTGGAWSSSATGSATITGDGVVHGVSEGETIISYTVPNSCGVDRATTKITVSPFAGRITGDSAVCVGYSSTLRDTAGGGTGIWSCSNTNATVSGGIITGITAGTSIITYRITNSCGIAFATKRITIVSAPDAGSIIGPSGICTGVSTILSDSIGGGTWSSSNPSIADIDDMGNVVGLDTGTVVISYAACGDVTTAIVSVNSSPVAGMISGPSTICGAGSVTYLSSVSGGTWSTVLGIVTIDSTGHATPAVSTDGEVDFIRYTVSYTYCSATVDTEVIIGGFTDAGTISGPTEICNTGSGHYWNIGEYIYPDEWSFHSTFGNVYIDSLGNVTGGIGGTTDIIVFTEYDVHCGVTATSSISVTIDDGLPDPGYISGSYWMCESGTDYSDYVSGGIWSTSSGIISIDSSGYATAYYASEGATDDIIYTVTNSCGSSTTDTWVNVAGFPDAGTITGPTEICPTGTYSYSSSGMGESITFSSTYGNIDVDVSGNVISATPFTSDVIVCTADDGLCGSPSTSELNVTVEGIPSASTISGADSVCVGSMVTLSLSVTDTGIWSSSGSNVMVSSGGIVTGVTTGTDTIYYAVSNLCGTTTSFITMTIDSLPDPGYISGPDPMCASGSYYSDYVSGGTWSTSSGVISIDGSGYATSSAYDGAGDDIIYTVTNSCGNSTTDTWVNVAGFPDAGIITGPTEICSTGTYSYSSSGSGESLSFSSTYGNIYISSSGIVDSAVAGTTDIIVFTADDIDCSVSATSSITVSVGSNPAADIISGIDSVCPGATITLSLSMTDTGIWSGSGSNAIVSPGGVVTGVAAGADTVFYSVSNMCGTTTSFFAITIDPLPDAGIILGSDSACTGASITMSETIAGGVWGIAHSSATVAGGIVTGASAGNDTVLYTATTSCGSAIASKPITILSLANPGTIHGLDSVCAGSEITIIDTVLHGTWRCSNGRATIDSIGKITGHIPGTDTVLYTVTNFCGADTASFNIRIKTIPSAGVITGQDTVCAGATISLQDPISGGAWRHGINDSIFHSGDSTFAISFTTGIDTVFYVVANNCGSDTASFSFMNDALLIGDISITGPDSLCVGSAITLTVSDTSSPGTRIWGSTDSNVHVTNGIASGSAAGRDTVLFTISDYCGSYRVRYPVFVANAPVKPVISGNSTVCIGRKADTLTTTQTGGIWSVTNGNTTVSGTGVVSAVNEGLDSVIYEVSNLCGTNADTLVITIPSPWECDSINLVKTVGFSGIYVYPNPNTGSFSIDIQDQGRVEIMISNIQGQEIGKQAIDKQNATPIQISLKNVASGAYFVRVNEGGKVYRGKVIIVK